MCTSCVNPFILVVHNVPTDSPSQWVDNLTAQKLLGVTGVLLRLTIDWPEKQPVC